MTKPKPRVIVLTGAGASQPLGLPTMEALLPDGFESRLEGEERDIFDMGANWAAPQNPTALDFELLFTMADTIANLRESDPVAMAFAAPRGTAGGFLFRQAMGSQINGGNLPAYRKAATRLAERLKVEVHERLATPDPTLAANLYRQLYSILGTIIDPPGVIDIFTTNYDRAVELSHETPVNGSSDFTFDLINGFAQVGNTRRPRLDVSVYDQPRGSRLTVRLYKIHGSLDWRRAGQFVEEAKADEYVKDKNAVIYPVRKPRLEEPFGKLLDLFKQRLAQSQVCVVIGSSLRDEHLRQALIDQIKAGALRVVVADPHAKEIAELLRKDLPKEKSAHLLIPCAAHFGGTQNERSDFEEKVRRAAADALLHPSP